MRPPRASRPNCNALIFRINCAPRGDANHGRGGGDAGELGDSDTGETYADVNNEIEDDYGNGDGNVSMRGHWDGEGDSDGEGWGGGGR